MVLIWFLKDMGEENFKMYMMTNRENGKGQLSESKIADFFQLGDKF